MARTIDGTTAAILNDPFIPVVLFCDLAFDSGTLYMHTDLGDISFSGRTYLGAGDMGSVEGIEEREDSSPSGLTLRLSGIDATLLDQALNQNYYDRAVTIYFGVRDIVTGSMVATPFEIFSGKMDQMRIVTGTGTSVIEIGVESEMIEFGRSLNRYVSDSQLQKDYPGDLGFTYLAAMQNARITIGSKSLVSFATPTPGSTTFTFNPNNFVTGL